MQQKIERLETYIDGLDALISDPNKMLGDEFYTNFFLSNSDLLHNEIGLINNFFDIRSKKFIRFLYSFYEFFEFLDFSSFDPKLIFRNLPDLLSYARQNAQKGLEPCLQEMAIYMKKILMPILQQWKEQHELQTTKDSNKSTTILTHLLEGFNNPKVIQREIGDPQIQQLTLFISGTYRRDSRERIRIIDIGAGFGDLITAINNSGIASKTIYIPIEIDKTKWKTIEERCKNSIGLEYLKPKDNIDNIKRADLIFFVNIFHELDLSNRVSYLFNAFRLTQKQGTVIIHEVVILPELEKDFFMWDKDDFDLIISKMKKNIDFIGSSTLTHPKGLPLDTICLHYKDDDLISENDIKSAIISSLEQIDDKWFNIKQEEKAKVNATKKRKKHIAFLILQNDTAVAWCKKYISKTDN